MESAVKMKTFLSKNPKARNGITQMIRMDKSTGQKGLKEYMRSKLPFTREAKDSLAPRL